MSSAVPLDFEFLMGDFEIAREKEKEQKELGTIVASLKGLGKTIDKIEGIQTKYSK